MGRLLLLSVLVATIAIPAAAARDRDRRRGLRRALWRTLLFDAVYLLAVLLLFPRL